MVKTNKGESVFLTPEEIMEFKEITNEVKGVSLTDDEASDQLSRAVMLFEAMQRFEPILLSGKDIVDDSRLKKENGGIK
jgi:hypothetical protein